ncbi:MAG: peptidogalycan biosysnthesis protein [Proteobacteria bacterium]|nr:peptidogalycan biosysnthesis protein [Pseudomonadota bacterium]
MSPDSPATFRNLLEPPALAELFIQHPPQGFTCRMDTLGLPVFSTTFDLLTTLESGARRRLTSLPLFSAWSRLLRMRTCFVGTTLTEYAPLPQNLSPETVINNLLAEHGQGQTLTIVKDLPDRSPLLPKEDNDFADALAALAVNKGFIAVGGQALAHVRIDFADIGEYLGRLSAGRRKDMRRKLRKRPELAVEILSIGEPRFFDFVFLDQLYAMYLAVFAQSEIHFDLLSREFFATLLQRHDIEGVVFLYWHEKTNAKRLAGYNICLIENKMLIDKYVGFTYPLARELNLYFISWMYNLEFALERGLHTYIAGWTDPQVKASLGASFTFTRHLVWVRNPLLRSILRPLRPFFESDGQVVRGAA